MRLTKGVTPPGGWAYQEGEFWIRGDDADDLIALVTSHRKENKKAIGEPWKDIERQVLERHPSCGVN